MLVAIAMGHLFASNVNEQTASSIGSKFLSTTVLGQEKAAIDLQLVSTVTNRGEVDYYVFNVKDGEGFVIVAGDDRVRPILAYSTTGSYDPQDVAEGFAFTLQGYSEEIHYVREHNLAATSDIVAEWKRVRETGSLNRGRSARAVVGPLCQTVWNQNYPYNSQCPEDTTGSGGHVYAGCVATAMSQVMKFYDYPERGTGSYTYYPDGYEAQTADYGNTDYHFELMPLSLDSTSTEEEIFYIAQLQHHAGIAVDMQYSGHGSGAYSYMVPMALQDHFGYSCDDHVANYSFWGWYDSYTSEQWIQMLKEGGLDEGIPLYYDGQDDSGAGGHAFVCDGYDENDYFHFNWGWSGRDDAWCPYGALHTTKYNFNQDNGYVGHVVPDNGEYFLRPDSVAAVQVAERGYDAVALTWTNPSLDLSGNALTDLDSVIVRRNNVVIATLTDVQPGGVMIYEDENLDPGVYEYAILTANESGYSRTIYRSLMVGEKCDVIFSLHDTAGNGWKGACISVTDENGDIIAVVTLEDGADETITLPLLKQNLSFFWNHGWYHNAEEYDTDSECSFSVADAFGNELYVSDSLVDGVFMTFDNNCEAAPLVCYPVSNLVGEYQWVDQDEFGAALSWDAPAVTTYLDHFQVIRTMGAYKDEELIAEIPFDGSMSYAYFDNTAELDPMDTYYSVNCIYVQGGEQCESEYRDVLVQITDVEENGMDQVRMYPNPTNGQLNIEGQGEMRIIVSNLLGQRVFEATVADKAVLDLSSFDSGIYMVRIETANGSVVKKVSLTR